MGAGWVHGITDNPLTKLCEEYKLTLHDLGENLKMYDQDGGHVDKDVDSRIQQAFNIMLDQTKDDGIRVAVKEFDKAQAAKEAGATLPEDSRDKKEVKSEEMAGQLLPAAKEEEEPLEEPLQAKTDSREETKSMEGQVALILAEGDSLYPRSALPHPHLSLSPPPCTFTHPSSAP
jgi:hypothetical protein